MIFGSLFLSNALNDFNMNKENFEQDSGKKNECISCVIVAMVVLVVELALFYFALDIAINTTTSNTERFIHVMLALLFTMPYLLIMVVFSKSARSRVGSSSPEPMSFNMCSMS